VIYGSKGAEGGYQEAIQLLEKKRLQIAPMITHRFPLDETAKGLRPWRIRLISLCVS